MASPVRAWAVALAVAAAVGLGAAVLFLSVYPIRGYDQPRGYDVARYLWRTSCVEAGGVGALRSCAPPAVGLAALVTGGLAADAAGLRLTPGRSLAIVLVAGAAGWVAAGAIGQRSRRIPPAEPVSPTILSC